MIKTFQIGQCFIAVNIGLKVLKVKAIAPVNENKMIVVKVFHQYNAGEHVSAEVETYDRLDKIAGQEALEWGMADA